MAVRPWQVLTSSLMNTLCSYTGRSICNLKSRPSYQTDLFVADGKFSLCLLVVLGKRLELLNWLALHDFDAELYIAFRVFVARLESY